MKPNVKSAICWVYITPTFKHIVPFLIVLSLVTITIILVCDWERPCLITVTHISRFKLCLSARSGPKIHLHFGHRTTQQLLLAPAGLISWQSISWCVSSSRDKAPRLSFDCLQRWHQHELPKSMKQSSKGTDTRSSLIKWLRGRLAEAQEHWARADA
jgi:hypothetical protein